MKKEDQDEANVILLDNLIDEKLEDYIYDNVELNEQLEYENNRLECQIEEKEHHIEDKKEQDEEIIFDRGEITKRQSNENHRLQDRYR